MTDDAGVMEYVLVGVAMVEAVDDESEVAVDESEVTEDVDE